MQNFILICNNIFDKVRKDQHQSSYLPILKVYSKNLDTHFDRDGHKMLHIFLRVDPFIKRIVSCIFI